MAIDQILFFSSDAEQLYKADIFRCLAVPDCYTIQFRYATKWVHPDILEQPQKIKGRPGLVIFIAGNDQLIPTKERKLTYYSIRFCTVKDAFFDHDTQQVIAILQLCQFVAAEWESDAGPPKYFLTAGRLTKHEPIDWIECARRLQSHYNGVLFFRVNRVLRGDEIVRPTYLDDSRMSRFDLYEETDYSLECLYYHPGGDGLLPLSMKCDSDKLELSNTFAFGAGAKLDKRRVHLKTGLLASRSARVFITFSSSKTDPYDDPNHLQILWELRRKRWKELLFTGSLLLAAVGLGLVQTGAKDQYGRWLSLGDASLKFLGAIFVAFGGGLLYRYFNKT